MLNKAVVVLIDIEFLKDEGLIGDFSAIHHMKDLDMIKEKMAHPKFSYKFLTDDELVISNY